MKQLVFGKPEWIMIGGFTLLSHKIVTTLLISCLILNRLGFHPLYFGLLVLIIMRDIEPFG